MIRRFLSLFGLIRRVPVVEFSSFIPQAAKESIVKDLENGKPMVLDGGAKLKYYER